MSSSSKTLREAKLFSGRSNPVLADTIAQAFGQSLGLITIKNFSDGEIWVKFEENIRGTDVFLIQSTNAPSDNLMELLIMIDAAKRASAYRITAVIPYFGYARQDRKDQPRVSITAKLVADLLSKAGADRILTMDLHTPQLQGFFNIPVDHLYASGIFVEHFKAHMDLSRLVVASPDIGGIHMARSYARRLNAALVTLDKTRTKHNDCIVSHQLIGDVTDKDVLLVDDVVDTGGTLCNGAIVLQDKGAKNIYVAATHSILSGRAAERLQTSAITQLFFTDSVEIQERQKKDKFKFLSVAPLLAEGIKRIHEERSISDLFPEKGPIL
jgi:ribose-phosphate pyrophosphokinase